MIDPVSPVKDRRARACNLVVLAGVASVGILLVAAAITGRFSTAQTSPENGTARQTEQCAVSAVVPHGPWTEVGGDHAFFHAGGPDASLSGPWAQFVWARFEPDAPAGGRVHIWADRFGSTDHVEGALNGRVDPRNIFARGSEAAPQLPGGWFLFEQRLPMPGCWRLSGAVDGRVAGSAVIRVMPGAPNSVAVGTFMTDAAVGAQLCFAFENMSYSREFPRDVPAWWWQQGASGDCSSRSSELVASRATIAPREDSGYELVLNVSPVGGTREELRVTLYPHLGKNAGVVTSAGNVSVFFTEVQHVGPSFDPLN